MSFKGIPPELAGEIARFDPKIPIERAQTPPASWYVSGSAFEHEKAAVFRRSWQPVARLEQLKGPGDFVAGEIGGLPYLVLRDREGGLRAFYNTCRHHAARILGSRPDGSSRSEGCVKELVCPYHGWTYALDGSLISAPRMKGAQDFKTENFGLAPIRAEAWGLWVWICMDPTAKGLSSQWSGLSARLAATGMDRLKFHSRRQYEIACNWKVYVDNYLDGGYHVPVLHRGLTSQLDMSSYRTEIFDGYSVQSCGGRAQAAERIGSEALYVWMYPGFMINRYGPVLDTNWVVPLSVDRTLTVFDFYFDETASESFIEKSLEASEKVQQEDVWISESVQKGLSSPAYGTGRYAPDVEQGEYHFHQLLANDLRAAK